MKNENNAETKSLIPYPEEYHRHVSSKHNYLDLKLKEIFRYKDLIFLFVKRAFKVSYKQTILGPMWLFINPFLSSIMHMIVFGNIAKLSTDGIPQLLFYFTGSALWGYFSGCLTGNSSVFVSYAGLFGKVYFPRMAVPISNVLSQIVRLGIQFIMIIALMIGFAIWGKGAYPNICLLWAVPLVIIQLGFMGMGAGIIISSLTTKYRDLTVLVGFGVSLLMYGTPVVYPLSQLSEGFLRTLIMINPVTAPTELFRAAVLGKGTVMWGMWGISWLFTAIVVFVGIIIFNRIERSFLDTV